ncbi:MAG: tRNA (N(6)-L-threonylcarbamoyladenosine(37)-C(2))-methylthiotransferase MtaB [Nitrospirae bacterium]|nr:tRNA (N(6)-L-threonylcarbamoyladenosine(37)-C(2))-methylthiotransferase MtaB [Nitrospirota bacterium]
MAESSNTTFTVISMGCRTNYSDSQALKQKLAAEGLRYVPFAPGIPADLYVINTCTVTSRADFDSRSWVRKAKQWNPDSTVVATGCYAQIQSAKLLGAGADLVLGNLEKDRIGEVLRLALEDRRPVVSEKIRRKGIPFATGTSDDQDRTRPVLKLQDGCDQCCSFCIIPTTRGHSRSLPPDAAVEQYRRLVGLGAREVVLSGINLSSYGEDLVPRTTLADLLNRFEGEKDGAWIRISSIEPSGLTEDLLAVIRSSRKICPHFHVPLQSGDSEVLERMNRPYSIEKYEEKIRALANVRIAARRDAGRTLDVSGGQEVHDSGESEMCIGTDVMVGFPGESEAQFENTLRAVEGLPFAYLHVFPYSVRSGTKAAKMKGLVDRKTRQRRSTTMSRLGDRKRTEFLQRQVGFVHEALVESRGKRPAEWRATTRNYIRMSFSGSGDLRNRIVKLRGLSVEGVRLHAAMVHEESGH